MSCNGAGNIKLEPVNVTFEIEHQVSVQAIADDTSSLLDKYFSIYAGDNTQYHVWFNVGAAGADPTPAGSTGIEVTIAVDDTAATVATAIVTAVDAEGDFGAVVVDSTKVLITAAAVGETTEWADVDSGMTLTVCQEGGTLDLGLLDGDVETSFEEILLSINCHQEGLTPLAELRQGITSEVSLTMKEGDFDKFKQIFASTAGGKFTPVAGTEVFGWGDSKQGLNALVQARRLNLNPVANGAADHSRDLTFWKAYPKPDTIVFSGENPQTLSMTFSMYLDDAKDSRIKMFCFGDYTQFTP